MRRSPALQVDSRGFTAGLDFNTSYKLPKQFTVQAFLYGALPRPTLQGRGPANLYYQFGGKKIFWHDKAELTLNLTTPFNQRWAYRTTLATPAFDQQSTSYAYQRAFRLTLSYRFGPQPAGHQRKSIQNNDLKGGTSKLGGTQ